MSILDNKDEEAKKLKTQWQHILVDVGKSETQVANELGTKQDILNRKIRNGTIQYLEFTAILQHLGYSIKIEKVED